MHSPIDDFERWAEEGYRNRPRPRLDVLRELHEEHLAHRAADRERDWRNQEVAALGRRVRALERVFLDRSGGLGGPLVGVLGKSLAKVRIDTDASIDGLRTEILALINRRIDEEFAARCPMSFCGVWDETVSYDRGSVVTHDGSLWIALTTTSGLRPNKSIDWRLAVKAEGRQPVVA